MANISIIIPTYKERDNIYPLLDRIDKVWKVWKKENIIGIDYEVLFVDDNSPDGTAEKIIELSNEYPARVIVRKDEKGLASAVVTGFNNSKGDIFVVMDADLQHPPKKIIELIKEIQNGADIAVANRYAEKDGLEELGFGRKIISKGANFPAKLLFRKLSNVSDIQSGFFALKRKVVEGVDLRPIGYKILLEILILGRYDNVTEIGYKFEKRESGESKLGPKIILEYLIHILMLAKRTGELTRFARYCFVGLIGIIVNTTALFLLTNLGIFYLISSIVAHEISIVGNFMINDNWTFKSLVSKNNLSDIIYRAIRYNMAKVSGILISIFLLFILTEFLSINYIYSNVIAIMMGVAWGYSTSLILVWRQ